MNTHIYAFTLNDYYITIENQGKRHTCMDCIAIVISHQSQTRHLIINYYSCIIIIIIIKREVTEQTERQTGMQTDSPSHYHHLQTHNSYVNYSHQINDRTIIAVIVFTFCVILYDIIFFFTIRSS